MGGGGGGGVGKGERMAGECTCNKSYMLQCT